MYRSRISSYTHRLLLAASCIVALSSCSSLNSMMGGSSEQDALRAMQWSYAADGVQIEIMADAHLNQSDNEPHNLLLAVMQMADPNPFTSATSTTNQLSSLLLSDSPSPGMLALNRLFISPGEQRTITLPRVEKAQYVSVALGYYHLDPARSTRLYRIGVDVDSSGILIKTRNAAPEPLTIHLRLGADGIQDSPAARTPPVTLIKPQAGPMASPAEATAVPSPVQQP